MSVVGMRRVAVMGVGGGEGEGGGGERYGCGDKENDWEYGCYDYY